jgi:membrane associated rhomboid family serine protease/tetratricopeptide (TPR) repeat protein
MNSPFSIDSGSNPPTQYPGRRYYPVIATYVILGVNVVIFILMTLAGGSKSVQVLLDFGASYGPFFRAGQYWRLVMPMFLHIGLAHLATNMFGLVLLGCFLEPLYGYGRFSLLYVVSGMAGSFLSMQASSHIAAGASGAIFGIAGAMLVTGFLHPQAVPRRWKNVFGIGILLVIVTNLAFGRFIKHIDNWAHLGGLLAGIILALLIPPARSRAGIASWTQSPVQPALIFPAAVVVIAMAAAASHYVKSGEVTSLVEASARMVALRQPDRALSLLQQARRIAPDDLRVHEALGAIYFEKRLYAQAILELRQALRLDPSSSPDTVALATAYENSGNLAKARQILEAAQKKAPENATTHEALAEVYASLKLYPAAIGQYDTVLKLAPNSPIAHNNLAWLYATCDDPQYRDPKGALGHAAMAVKLTDWRQPEFIDTLAAALFANGQSKLAAEAEGKAVQLEPGNPEFRASLARYRKAAGT